MAGPHSGLTAAMMDSFTALLTWVVISSRQWRRDLPVLPPPVEGELDGS